MVSSEEVRRTRGCRGRHVFSPAAAQGTLASASSAAARVPSTRYARHLIISLLRPRCLSRNLFSSVLSKIRGREK